MTRILVIEDEAVLRRNVLEMLEFEGFETAEAADGLQGLQAARELLPDLIVCDIMMPELDGYGVLEELRRDSTTAIIPFIFLTAKADRESMRVGMNLGADDYLTKPFTQAELLTAIHSRLNRHNTIESQRLEALLRRSLQMQESERQHVARQLSQDVEHMLAGLKMIVNSSEYRSADANRLALMEAETLINQLSEAIGALSYDLRPVALDDLGLLPALLKYFDRYTAQTQIKVHFRHVGLQRRLSSEIEGAAFRIVQEALTNVSRHTAVREVGVAVWIEDGRLWLRIEDRGNGFDLESALNSGSALGLARMHSYAMALGGELVIKSARGSGTRVSASLPILSRTPSTDVPEESASSAPYMAAELYARNARARESQTITVGLAVRHDLIRQSMRSMFDADPTMTVVGEATDGAAAINLVARLRPAVLMVEFSLPGLSGLDVARQVGERFPLTQVVILSSQADEAYAFEALRCGAAGYALKQSGVAELIRAVREVAAGRRYLSPAFPEDALERYMSTRQAQDDSLSAHHDDREPHPLSLPGRSRTPPEGKSEHS